MGAGSPTRSNDASSTGWTSPSSGLPAARPRPASARSWRGRRSPRARKSPHGSPRSRRPDMARLLRMPEVAANTVEAVLAEWPIAENTPFRSTDAIATVETEKAVVDVPADTDGVILKMLVPAGAAVEVGAPIALLGDPGEQVEDLDALLAELGVGSATVTSAPAAAPVTSAPAAVAGASGVRIFSSPLARRLAKEAGLSIADLAGTGPGGRIVRQDVEKAAYERDVVISEPRLGQPWLTPTSSSATATTAAAAEPISQAGGASGQPPRYQDTPHTRMRRAIAARLTQSTRDTPHFSLHGTPAWTSCSSFERASM